MSKKDKFTAWFLTFQGVAGLAVFAWMATHSRLAVVALCVFLLLAIAALAAGIGSLAGKRWALLFGIAIFAVQVPVIATPSFRFSVWLGVHLYVGGTWAGHVTLGINLVGLVMFIWSVIRYKAICSLRSRRREMPHIAEPDH